MSEDASSDASPVDAPMLNVKATVTARNPAPQTAEARRTWRLSALQPPSVKVYSPRNRDTAHELPNLSLEDALQLVHLDAERGSPKYEKAAMRWLERYLTESSPRLQHFAEVASDLAILRR